MTDKPLGLRLANAIEEGVQNIKECTLCRTISENEFCDICIDENRDKSILCIVESSKDLFYIEDSGVFNGRYFVLLDTVLSREFTKLENIIKSGIKEVLFALTPSASNDGVMLFIEDRLKEFDLKFTKIARGIPTGISIQNVDMLSIISSFESKIDA